MENMKQTNFHLFVTAPQLGCSAGQGEGAERKAHPLFLEILS